MSESDKIARGAAQALAGKFGPQLKLELEKQIAAPGEAATQTYAVAEAVSIATFLLSVAKFGYDIYKDQRDRKAVDMDVIRRETRLKVKAPRGLSAEKRDAIIDAIAKELEMEE